MSEIRRDCRWYLRYGSSDLCRRMIFKDPKSEFKKLDLGCDCDPEKDYEPQQWKRDLYGDPDERGDVPRVVDWEEET